MLLSPHAPRRSPTTSGAPPAEPGRTRSATSDGVRLSARDREILALACRKLAGTRADFREALRALREAVEETIPAGRIYVLANDARGPVVGSLVSSVGIADGEDGVAIVRVEAGSMRTWLGRFEP